LQPDLLAPAAATPTEAENDDAAVSGFRCAGVGPTTVCLEWNQFGARFSTATGVSREVLLLDF
jgi:hypothetical protein